MAELSRKAEEALSGLTLVVARLMDNNYTQHPTTFFIFSFRDLSQQRMKDVGQGTSAAVADAG